MPELVIYGASDDLVELEGLIDEEFNVQDDELSLFVNCHDGRGAIVTLRFGRGGVWSVSYSPVEEDAPAPVGIVSMEGYTAKLTLDVPEDTTVRVRTSDG